MNVWIDGSYPVSCWLTRVHLNIDFKWGERYMVPFVLNIFIHSIPLKTRLWSQFHYIYTLQTHRKQKTGKNNDTNWTEMPRPRFLLFLNTRWSHWKCLQLARMWWVINYTLLMHQRLDVPPYWLNRYIFRLDFGIYADWQLSQRHQ